MTRKKGFSLLEVLIVIAIMAILAVVGSGFYRGYVKNVESETVARTIVSDTKLMRSKAMIGEGGLKWGTHFVNSASDYYEIFSTPTTYADGSKEVVATTTLPKGITFSDPTEGNTKDVIFSRIAGTTTATTIVVSSEGNTRTITVTSVGAVH